MCSIASTAFFCRMAFPVFRSSWRPASPARCRSSPGLCRRNMGCALRPLSNIVSRPPPTTPGGSVTLYGGSHGTGQTAFDYGAKIGQWEVFAAGRLIMNSLGIENPTSSYEAIHDRTRQGKFFGFLSYAIDDATKLSFITGTSVANYQIPNNPGQPPQFEAFRDRRLRFRPSSTRTRSSAAITTSSP